MANWDIEIGHWLNIYVFNMFEAWEMMSSLLDEDGSFLVKIRKFCISWSPAALQCVYYSLFLILFYRYGRIV